MLWIRYRLSTCCNLVHKKSKAQYLLEHDKLYDKATTNQSSGVSTMAQVSIQLTAQSTRQKNMSKLTPMPAT